MKKLIVALAFVLASCLFLSACEDAQPSLVSLSPFPSCTTDAISSATLPSAPDSEEPTGEEEIHIIDSFEIERANNCRKKVGDTVYYLDTSKFIEMHVFHDFPLYRHKDGKSRPEYLGTTGFEFQIYGKYLYIESDLLYEAPPECGATRIVDLDNLNIISIGREVNIFFPKQESKIYYTKGSNESIFIADPSLWKPKELSVEVPNKDTIEQRIRQSIDDVFISIDIVDVKDNWIYFSYSLYDPEGPLYYEGNYRIKTDGSKIEKIGEGQFGDEEDNED